MYMYMYMYMYVCVATVSLAVISRNWICDSWSNSFQNKHPYLFLLALFFGWRKTRKKGEKPISVPCQALNFLWEAKRSRQCK